MPCSGCSALHGVNPIFFKKRSLSLTILPQNHFNLENMKEMTKMLLPPLELTDLIINFLLPNLETALKTLPNFKKLLMTKKYFLHDSLYDN